MEEAGNSKSRARYYLRVLRPLFYWFLLVLVLFGIRAHQRLMERTRLYFDLSLDGRKERYMQSLLDAGDTPFGAAASFEGKPIRSGDKIPLGQHTFTIIHPKAVPFSTNLFIWYGPHDFGVIDLKRAKGTLTVTADPPAPILSVEGPESSATLTNSSGLSRMVPTDQYTITAQYAHVVWRQSVIVTANGTTPVRITPKFGSLQLSCNQSGATYQLSDVSGNLMQTGDLPAIVADLQEGTYKLVSWHHNHESTERVFVRAGNTNTLPVDFQYGMAILETTPPGAAVFDSNGLDRGVTPLTVSELQPGIWKFKLQLYNYEPTMVTLSIAANQTNAIHTNLVSLSYTGAMRAARQFMNDGKYDEAAQSLADALGVQPGDSAATALQKEAIGLGAIARAESLGKQGDYIAGIDTLNKALAVLPENERAKQMLADFKQHEPEQRVRLEQEHIEAWTNTINAFTEKITGATLVESHELKTSKQVSEVQTAIAEQFRSVVPTFKLSHVGWTNEVFFMDADQEVSGGGRLCLIVGAQIKDGDTRIRFKVIEYKSEAFGLKILGAVLATATSTAYQSNYKPINPSDVALSESDKKRISEGVQLVTEKIQRAIGSTAPSK